MQLEAEAGAIEQAETFYNQAQYSYTWTAPLVCYFSFDPSTAVQDGEINGTTTGFSGIPTIRLEFTTVQPASNSPTKAMFGATALLLVMTLNLLNL